MLAGCLALLIMSFTAITMWWKRRPQGSLGAPPLPDNWRAPRTILFVAVAFGTLFPLLGASLLIALAVELTRGYAAAAHASRACRWIRK